MNIEEKILQSRAELTMKYLQNFFENNHLKNLERVFSIFGKEYLKRPLENQILLFKENIFDVLNFNYDKINKSNLFPGEIYKISYEKNKLLIEYFVFDFKNKEVPKIVEKLKKWDIKNFDFLEDLELFRIKYEIRLGNGSSFKSIKYYNPKSIDKSHLFLKDYDDFSEVFIKSLEISDNKSGMAKDILELYEETKKFRSNFQLTYKVDDEDFENFQSLYDFLKSKYNIPNTEKFKKIPLSIMEKFFEDEFLRFEENRKIINFILKNKTDFLSEMVNFGIWWKNQKGIIETYFDASGIFDKLYNSKLKEYDNLEKQVKEEGIICFPRRRKGTIEYVKDFLMETFYLGKNLNIRNIVNQIEECNSFKELEILHNKLSKIKTHKKHKK